MEAISSLTIATLLNNLDFLISSVYIPLKILQGSSLDYSLGVHIVRVSFISDFRDLYPAFVH